MTEKFKARRFLKGDSRNQLFEDSFPEFTENACKLLDTYLEIYQIELDEQLEGPYQMVIRHWLNCQDKKIKAGYDPASIEVADYFIKATLRIIPIDFAYERSVGIYR